MRKTKIYPVLLVLLLWLMGAIPLEALNPDKKIDQYVLDAWTTDDGLPQNSIVSLLQTGDGYLLGGTQRGIFRFNGMDFEVFNKINTPALRKSDFVTCLLKHSDGSVWIGTQDGELIRMQDWKFENIIDNTPLAGNAVNALGQDGEGNLWIGCEKKGLWILKKGKNIPRQVNEATSLSRGKIVSIIKDRKGDMWLASPQGVLIFSKASGRFSLLNRTNGLSANDIRFILEDYQGRIVLGTREGRLDILSKGQITSLALRGDDGGSIGLCIYEDHAFNLWVGTRSGLARVKLEGGSRGRAEFFTAQKGLSINVVSDIFEDREGSLWLSTTLGINRLRDGKVTTFKEEHGLANNLIWCLLEDENEDLWLGTNNKGIIKAEKGDIKHSKVFNDLPGLAIRSLCSDLSGRLWVGTRVGPALIENDRRVPIPARIPPGLLKAEIRSIFLDSNGTLWFGSSGGIFYLKDNRFSQLPLKESYARIHCFCEDSKGTLWAGTRKGALAVNLADYSYSVFGMKKGLPNNVVLSLLNDSQGTVWFGTYLGISRLKDGAVTSVNTTDGLPNNVVYSLLNDGKGNIWSSTDKGIARIKLSELNNYLDGKSGTLNVETYGRYDGMSVAECNGGNMPAGVVSRSGQLWFPSSKGAMMVDPSRIHLNKIQPPVVIRDVVVDSLHIDCRADCLLKAGTKKIEFHYAALSFIAPKNVRYKYMLENFDEHWVEGGSRRAAYYTNLPPGNYRFKVIAANNDGVWNFKGAVFNFELEPFFYQTPFFYLILGMTLFLFTYGFYRFRVNQLKRSERELAQMVAVRTRDLENKKRELEKANRQVRLEQESAESANRTKSEFLARMSHEIRTPMNSIIGFTDIMQDSGLSPEQQDYVGTIKQSSRALLTLINDILDFSKIEAGQLTFENIDFDPEIAVFNVCESIRPRLEGKDIEVLCSIGDYVPAFLLGDPGRFRQVLLNLMGNAVKFTEKGEIELAIRLSEENKAGVKIHTTVRDTGIGIPDDKLNRIFEVFNQADGSITRKFGGTGLGLAICKQIAHLLDGEVWVESKTNHGSTFHFTAWFCKSQKKVGRIAAFKKLAGLRVLVVDDNLKNLDILEHLLEKAGIHCQILDHPESVLPLLQKAVLEKIHFDMCILDIQMPGMSGYELCSLIRAVGPPYDNIPILAFSSSFFQGAQKSKNAGFDGFLPKPISRKRLFKMMERLLQPVAPERSDQTAEPIITQHTIEEEAKHNVHILLAEDNIINQKLARVMLTKAGYQLDIVDNGKKAVDSFILSPGKYGLILMDIQMPEMDGLEATRSIRQQGFDKIPIIAMTAGVMKGDKDRCLQAGMNDFISKPIKRERVLEMVMKWALY
ncbi:MAG: response regulator [bacterium]|nr:response regulator [bacterium]